MISNFKFAQFPRFYQFALKPEFVLGFLTALFFFACVVSVPAQKRDNLTDAEADLVRDAQEIDLRMKVFVKAIDRRFMVLNNEVLPAKELEKDAETWGKLPIGTRLELSTDIQKLLDEAIQNIDDVAERDMKNELFPIGVHVLADGAKRFLPLLKTQLDKATDNQERGVMQTSIELCNQIIEASAKVPRTTRKDLKKKNKNESKDN